MKCTHKIEELYEEQEFGFNLSAQPCRFFRWR